MNALLPFSWVYGAGVALDRRVRSVPKLRPDERPRVIAIGNLEAGGNGKTPLAMLLMTRALAAGASVACVSRGYGSASVSAREVTCVLPAQVAPSALAGLRVLSPSHPDLAREIGDEGALMVERVPGAMAFFCADKRRAVHAAAACGATRVFLDDGFQSWTVARHSDAVLLDAERPLDGGHLLPAGRLREGPGALGRADAIVFNGAATLEALAASRERVARWIRPGVPVAGLVRRGTLVAVHGSAGATGKRLLAVSGIARPEAFACSLATAGVDAVAHEVFPDHHRYRATDIARIVARAEREKADAFVTTEKDWMKLRRMNLPLDVCVARLEVSLIGDALPE